MTIPGLWFVARLAGSRWTKREEGKKKRNGGILSYFSHWSREPVPRANGRTVPPETRRSSDARSSVITALDADLLCGPVKHLYQLIRGELTACPAAHESAASRKLAKPVDATRSNVNAKWQVRWVQRSTRAHPSPRIPRVLKCRIWISLLTFYSRW